MNRAGMETKASRTLVKSVPELWGLANDEPRMGLWMAALTGEAGPVDVEVTHRSPKRTLVWQRANGGPSGRIALTLAEKGFGTSIAITAHHEGTASLAARAMENLLDDLGSPERQPFARA